MEGVPRLPMLKCELKRSPDNEGIASRLRALIHGRYGESDFEEEIREFKALRATSCIKVARNVSGIAEVKKYYAQLSFLKNRLHLDPDDEEGGITWSWYTLHNEGNNPVILAFNDISLEMSSVLYNSGALHSILAAEEPRVSSEEMKMACTHFQCAAWAFHVIPDRCSNLRSSDLDPDVLAFLSQVCLAQAQECILEKSILDHRKATIVAKVGAQVVDYYLQAKKKMDGSISRNDEENILDIVGSKLAKTWLHYVDFKMHFYTAVSFYYMGLQSEESQKMGERVAYLEAASSALKTASSKGKLLVSSSFAAKMFDKGLIGNALSFSSDVINGKYDNAKKENEFIYHESVPDINTLPELKGASLVKGIGFEVTDPDISGKDIFSKLVPIEAHESSSLYSEEKAKVLRNIGDEVEKKDSELAVFLASLSLDEIPEPGQQVSLPPELIECVAGLSVKKDAISKLAEAMKQIDTVTGNVDSAIKELEEVLKREELEEKEFEALMGSKRSSALNTDLKRELETFVEAKSVASESTLTLHNAMELHLGNFKLLSKPLEELEKIIPSMKDLDEESEKNLGEMLRIYDKVKEMKSQRVFLLDKLRDQIQNDDITKKLILYKNKDLSEVFSTELKKYDSVKALMKANLDAQSNILQIFADTNAKYVDTRCTISELLTARKDMINSLIDSYHTYDDLLHKTAKGLQFYDKLESNVSKALSKAKGVVKVQSEERDALIAKNSAPRPNYPNSFNPAIASAPPPSGGGGGGGGPSKPTLKDYLTAMKSQDKTQQVYQGPGAPVIPQYPQPSGEIPKSTAPPSMPATTNVVTATSVHSTVDPKVSAPLNFPPPRSTYTSGTVPSNNMTLATASPQIQQQEQHRQYYHQPGPLSTTPSTNGGTPYYQYPSNAATPLAYPNMEKQPGMDKSKIVNSPASRGTPNLQAAGVANPYNQQAYYGQNYGQGPNNNTQYYAQSHYMNQQPPSTQTQPTQHHQYGQRAGVGGNYTPSYPHSYPSNNAMGQPAPYPYNTYPTTSQQTNVAQYPSNNTGVQSNHHNMTQQQNPFLTTTTQTNAVAQPQNSNHIQSQQIQYPQPYPNHQQHQAYVQHQTTYPGRQQIQPPTGYNYNSGSYPYNHAPVFQQQSQGQNPTQIHPEPKSEPVNNYHPASQPYGSGNNPPSNIPLNPLSHNGEGGKREEPRKSSVDKILSDSPEEGSKKTVVSDASSSPSASLSSKGSSDSKVLLKPKVMTALDREEEKEVAKITKEINDASAHDPYESSETLKESLLQETNALESTLREILSQNSPTLDKIWKDVKTTFDKGPVLKISVARCYPMKNRDSDVLPYDHNRVELPSTKDDYINASHIKGLSQYSPRFIATQSPTSGTLSDFWIMVWQEQVETLVNLVPEETPNTFIYWPTDRKTPLKVGSLHITLQSTKNESPFLSEKIMTVLNQATNTSRVVVFIQAYKQINSKSSLLDLVTLLLTYHRQQRVLTHPLVIHCQLGSFKTASVILLSACLSEINVGHLSTDDLSGASTLIPSLPSLSGQLMRQRKGIIREKESLKIVYEALLLHCHNVLLKYSLIRQQPPLDGTNHDALEEESKSFGVKDLSKLVDDISVNDSTMSSSCNSPLKKITKQDFLKPSSGLNPDFKSDDPLSQLDPLWSLKSKN